MFFLRFKKLVREGMFVLVSASQGQPRERKLLGCQEGMFVSESALPPQTKMLFLGFKKLARVSMFVSIRLGA